jgi:toxin ParE1/3/4
MTFDFHPAARLEYLEAAIDRILQNPNAWRVIAQDVRRCLTHTFPYGILYTIEPESILIVAVMHLHRQPGYWRDRI